MADVRDMELLRDYARQGSEEAFAALVQRHVNLVYSVALRKVGVAAQAEEITQAVFVLLARKAARLGADTVLEGWLHETTRLTAGVTHTLQVDFPVRERHGSPQGAVPQCGSQGDSTRIR